MRKRHIITDNKPAALKAQQQALDAALQSGVRFDDILTAAKPWAAAYDNENNDRQFLPSLSDWLSSKGWEQQPPDRSKQRKANGHANGKQHYHRKPKSKENPGDPFLAEVGLERGPDGVLRQRRPH